jgi:transposase
VFSFSDFKIREMTTRTYHRQLRERIVASRQECHSAEAVSKWFKVSKRSVERYWKSQKEEGTIEPKRRGGYRRSRLEGHDDTLQRWINEQPDLTLEELRQRCETQLGVRVGINALWQRLDKLGLSFKKNAVRQRAEPSRRAGRPKKMERPAV